MNIKKRPNCAIYFVSTLNVPKYTFFVADMFCINMVPNQKCLKYNNFSVRTQKCVKYAIYIIPFQAFIQQKKLRQVIFFLKNLKIYFF